MHGKVEIADGVTIFAVNLTGDWGASSLAFSELEMPSKIDESCSVPLCARL